ncbi:ANTAR domain-containing protein [Jiangella aurantiaca]|uniref:ANTAR domain-containing protein n=1 Tax=Jiangella aurantiaca TaxID=2530373 RepID=A0A4R5A106_9ACTN|nr:GAF and ANTAR domain-containing protein [Jiangella aurantiaca]TDD65453.1 ANTAR domain-containing protein [Jiangella aurantiaca]
MEPQPPAPSGAAAERLLGDGQRPAGRGGRDGLVAGLLDLVQVSFHTDDLPDVLRSVAHICAAALGDEAAVSVTHGPPPEPGTVATSSKLAQTIDGAQALATEGPSQTAWAGLRTVASADLAADPRWPALRPLVAGLPLRAAVAAPLTAGAHPAGALNVYLAAESLGDDTVARIETLAAAVSAVLHELELRHELRTRVANLERALLTRPAIDMAKGIIMGLRRCGPDEAFQAMVRASKNGNVKVRDLAARIVADAAAGRPLSLE